ncbi:interleukin-18 receptor 1-like [Brachyistius frenatus]|uniref:interleukin-18 receptor 1-like n=1 Tax=Brachyistius frenatus TaxID=100188 RepID=UPI0037E920E7
MLHAKAGEMVVLHCPQCGLHNDNEADVFWTSHTTEHMNLTDMSTSDEPRQMDLLVHGRSLVILRASVKHQGNYSCSPGTAHSWSWFTLTVYATQSREYDENTQYSSTCYTQESCTLYCPSANVPCVHTPNITSNGIIWHKEGESSPRGNSFSSVDKNDRGSYTCTRSYLYHGQTYNKTFTVILDVQPSKKYGKSKILSPQESSVFHVVLDSTVVIDCEAVLYSDFDLVFWLSGKSFVETNNSLPVFYTLTSENNSREQKVIASLVFQKVSYEDLSKQYTCKLESDHQLPSFVTITLTQKGASSLPLVFCITVVLIVVTIVVCVKFKINITLFLRDTLGCYRRTSDGKSYDAYLMYYESITDTGLNEDDRRWLERVLEERFGYNLCIFDRDVSSGEAAAVAVLDCIELSRMVVLVPTSPGSGPGSDLLKDIHAALVERKTRLVLINTAQVSSTGSLPEALQRLSEAGHCVTWKGRSSMSPSSSFWKQLRYYLPAPRLLPHIPTQDYNQYNIGQSE